MADNNNIDSLDIEIKIGSSQAEKGVDALADSLLKLHKQLAGISAVNISNIGGSAKEVKQIVDSAGNVISSFNKGKKSKVKLTLSGEELQQQILSLQKKAEQINFNFNLPNTLEELRREITKTSEELKDYNVQNEKMKFYGANPNTKSFKKLQVNIVESKKYLEALQEKLLEVMNLQNEPVNISFMGAKEWSLGDYQSALEEYKENIQSGPASEGFGVETLLEDMKEKLSALKSQFPEATEAIREFEVEINKVNSLNINGGSEKTKTEIQDVKTELSDMQRVIAMKKQIVPLAERNTNSSERGYGSCSSTARLGL